MIRRSGQDQAEDFQQAWESHAAGRRRAAGSSVGEVDDLLRVTQVLVASAAATPSPMFRDALRERLMAEAADVLVAAPAPAARASRPAVVETRPGRARRRLAGVAVAAISSAGFVGLVATSAQALPGDTLYPVKRGVESVELAMHRDDASRGSYRLDLATERLSEAREIMARPGGATQVPELLEEFTSQAEAGSAELFDSFGSTASTGDVERVNDFTAAAALDLGDMSDQVPEGAVASFESASAVVADLAGQAARLCGSCHAPDVSALLGASGAKSVTQPSKAAPGRESAGKTSSSESSSKPRTGASAAPSPRTGATSGATPSAPPASPSPTPSARPTPEGVGKVLEPVVTTLFGDETSPGLVPGVLDGLLGGGSR